MSKICDRSPCDWLLGAIGSFIFGSKEGFYMTVWANGEVQEVDVEYCNHCGTRLDQVPAIAVEKFTRPRRRRKPKQPALG